MNNIIVGLIGLICVDTMLFMVDKSIEHTEKDIEKAEGLFACSTILATVTVFVICFDFILNVTDNMFRLTNYVTVDMALTSACYWYFLPNNKLTPIYRLFTQVHLVNLILFNVLNVLINES